jgi:hypothetical protein
MEAIYSFETSFDFQRTTQRYMRYPLRYFIHKVKQILTQAETSLIRDKKNKAIPVTSREGP